MSEFKIKSFAEYQKFLNESMDNSQVEEDRHKDKTVYNDIRGKEITDDTKIKIAMGTPDTEKGEVMKFDFKYVNSEDIDPTAAKKKAIDELTSMIASQVDGGQLKPDMVGVIDIKKEGTRTAGDYVYKGAVSFYQGNHFTPDQLQNATAIATIPGGTPESGKTQTEEKLTSTVKEEATMPLFEDLKIYDASTIGSSEVKADIKSMLDAPSKVQEPSPDTTQTTTTAPPATDTTTTTTAVPVSTQQPQTSYVGIKKGLNVNPAVQELQAKIIALGGAGATMLNAKGGADGKYGDATAQAIAEVAFGDHTKPVPNPIDQATSDALNKALANVKPEDVAKIKKPVAAAKPATPAGSQQTSGETLTLTGNQKMVTPVKKINLTL